MYWGGIGAAANAAAAYQTGQTGYQVGHTPTAGAYTTQRAPGSTYDTTYQTAAAATHTSGAATYPTPAASTTYDYGYGRPAQTATAAAVTYDSSKAYYAQPSAATAPVAYTTAETHYQNKSAYSNSSHYTTTARQQQQQQQQQQTPTSVPKTSYSPSPYTNAVAAAASTYNPTPYTQQSTTTNKATTSMYMSQPTTQQSTTVPKPANNTWQNNNFSNKKGPAANKTQKTKPPPKPQQLHYCDVCKISCAGPQTYREHLDGQKHKKKEASVKAGPTPSRNGASLRCELCDVTCTGSDAYAAHIRGAKHQKVVKLHQKLGKPIPSTDPVVVGTGNGASKSTATSGSNPGSKTSNSTSASGTNASSDVKKEENKDETIEFKEKEVEPMGHEYIEEMKVDDKIVSFNCKLCDCKFNDPNAKEMHMKGRRHRLQYKKKVNPKLVVEVKPSLRQRKLQEEKIRRQQYFGPQPMRRPESSDDRHVIAKHAEIYPKEEELTSIQKIVSNTEKALKLVSDYLSEADGPKDQPKNKKTKEIKVENEKKPADKKDDGSQRMLKGVMRVGILAKGLLLRGDTNVQLVVLCGDKPTRSLLDRVADNLPKQLSAIAPDEKYEIYRVVEDAAIVVQSVTGDYRIAVSITLTSPVMREHLNTDGDSHVAVTKDPPDVLDKQKCLDALAALRHAKWFQARANGLQSCVMIIRIIRELSQRLPTWGPLNNLTMELMCEKIIASANQPLTPGDALKRIFEALSSGLLLPGSPGLMDPCEKDPVDAAMTLSAQEREDITASAQHALRLLSFRQIHKVLGMDQLPNPKFFRRNLYTRKRRRDNSAGEGNDSEAELNGGDGKKDKKENGEEAKMDLDKPSK